MYFLIFERGRKWGASKFEGGETPPLPVPVDAYVTYIHSMSKSCWKGQWIKNYPCKTHRPAKFPLFYTL